MKIFETNKFYIHNKNVHISSDFTNFVFCEQDSNSLGFTVHKNKYVMNLFFPFDIFSLYRYLPFFIFYFFSYPRCTPILNSYFLCFRLPVPVTLVLKTLIVDSVMTHTVPNTIMPAVFQSIKHLKLILQQVVVLHLQIQTSPTLSSCITFVLLPILG